MDIVISIVGFGNIGKLICALLLPYRGYNFTINIVDIDSSVEGAITDLQHGNQLHRNHSISYNSDFLFNNSDFIFHCAGASVPKGKSRLYTCQQSIEMTEAIFKNFKPVKTPFIIVVANPVEIISAITYKMTGLPHSHIIGTGTFLDSIRMNHIIRKRSKEGDSIDAVLLGEHGTSAFLSEQLSTVNGKSFSDYFGYDCISECMISVKNAAEEIKATQGATIYGVSYCAIHIFELLLSEKGEDRPVSVLIPDHLKQELGESDVFLSLYARINQTGANPVTEYQPNEAELSFLQESVNLILPFIPKQYL